MVRWRPFVQWILAIPHLIIANVISSLSQVIAFVSWFVIVFTGKLPEGLANLQAMCIRYQIRAYSYAGFLRTSYPAFEFDMTQAEPGGDEVSVELPAQLEDRNRLTVGLRLFMLIPIAIVGILWSIVAMFVGFIGAFGLLLRDEFPPLGL
jgi:hypothetical protein